MLTTYINQIEQFESLSFEQMQEAASLIFMETTPEEQIERFLIALSEKGETAAELAGLALIMREHAVSMDVPEGLYMDNCGTGGDGLQTFNISTTSAFVLAGAGIKVAKHGNRKISSQTGSSDVLEALGMGFIEHADTTAQAINEVGIAFLHAPNFHPKLGRIGAIRRKIGKPTIFNFAGPLTNPVPLQTQFVGISRPTFAVQYAEVLHLLGRKRAIVVSGAHRMDEANLAGENTFVMLDHGDLIPFKLKPEEFGLTPAPLQAIRGGNPDENAEILKDVLKGIYSPYLQTVLLNAGIALFAYGKTTSIEAGIDLALQVIQSGAAYEKLDHYIKFTKKVGV